MWNDFQARTRLVSVGLILAGALSVHAPAANAQSGRLKALIGGTLVDGFGGKPIRDSIVIIHGERIKTVGTIGALPVPKEAEVISTEGMSVMPDCGTCHVGIQTVLTGSRPEAIQEGTHAADPDAPRSPDNPPRKPWAFCRHRSSPRRAPESHLWPIETHHGKSVLAAGHEVVDR